MEVINESEYVELLRAANSQTCFYTNRPIKRGELCIVINYGHDPQLDEERFDHRMYLSLKSVSSFIKDIQRYIQKEQFKSPNISAGRVQSIVDPVYVKNNPCIICDVPFEQGEVYIEIRGKGLIHSKDCLEEFTSLLKNIRRRDEILLEFL